MARAGRLPSTPTVAPPPTSFPPHLTHSFCLVCLISSLFLLDNIAQSLAVAVFPVSFISLLFFADALAHAHAFLCVQCEVFRSLPLSFQFPLTFAVITSISYPVFMIPPRYLYINLPPACRKTMTRYPFLSVIQSSIVCIGQLSLSSNSLCLCVKPQCPVTIIYIAITVAIGLA